MSRYFAYDGYKLGMHGFVLSFLQMMYYPLVYFYFWERKQYQDEPHDTTPNAARSFFTRLLFEINHWMVVKKLVSGALLIKLRIVNKLLK